MAMLNIEKPEKVGRFALLYLGFRPFFLGAGLWAVIGVLLWLGIYALGWRLPLAGLSPTLWHAHEMVFGYAVAVIAGFLLTSVKNWTNQQTWNGARLAALVLLWAAARVLFALGGPDMLTAATIINALFLLGLFVAIGLPVARARQWNQLPVIIIPALLFIAQLLVILAPAPRTGIYAGLFLVVLLIFIMGRRVIPFFIERGVDEAASIRNPPALDIACIATYLIYAVAEFTAPVSPWTALFAWFAAVAHGVRLYLWYTPGGGRKPLLWVLWLGYAFLVLGLVMRAMAAFWWTNPFLGLHALTYGGIGLITLGMMARVSLGHTGRNVFEPPKPIGWMFALLAAGTVVRVLMPLVLPASYYGSLIIASQLLWIAAFALFVAFYGPMLVLRRIDGRYG